MRTQSYGTKMKTCSRKAKTKKAKVVVEQKKFRYICFFCYKCFTSKCGFDIHTKMHYGEKPTFYCAHCPATFYRRDLCKRHLITHGKNPASHCCHKCLKTFASACELLRHEPEHSIEKKNKCRFCAKRFRSKEICDRHEMIYHDGLPHVCRACLKKFHSNLALIIHKNNSCLKSKGRTIDFVVGNQLGIQGVENLPSNFKSPSSVKLPTINQKKWPAVTLTKIEISQSSVRKYPSIQNSEEIHKCKEMEISPSPVRKSPVIQKRQKCKEMEISPSPVRKSPLNRNTEKVHKCIFC